MLENITTLVLLGHRYIYIIAIIMTIITTIIVIIVEEVVGPLVKSLLPLVTRPLLHLGP